jgi:hypothetical protein
MSLSHHTAVVYPFFSLYVEIDDWPYHPICWKWETEYNCPAAHILEAQKKKILNRVINKIARPPAADAINRKSARKDS